MEREAAPSKAAVTSPDAATAQPIAASSLGAVQEASNAGVASAAAAGPSALLAAPGTPAAAAAARPPSSLQAGTSTSTAGAGKPAGGGREAARRLSGGTQADVMTPPVCLALSLASVGIAGLLLMTPGLASGPAAHAAAGKLAWVTAIILVMKCPIDLGFAAPNVLERCSLPANWLLGGAAASLRSACAAGGPWPVPQGCHPPTGRPACQPGANGCRRRSG